MVCQWRPLGASPYLSMNFRAEISSIGCGTQPEAEMNQAISSTADLVVTNVRPAGGPSVNIVVKDGRVMTLTPELVEANETIDGGNSILLPALVEAHTHLDKTLLGMSWYRNEVGPRLVDRIDNERLQKRVLGIDPARQSARQIRLSVSKGTTHIRSHVDVDTDSGLAG